MHVHARSNNLVDRFYIEVTRQQNLTVESTMTLRALLLMFTLCIRCVNLEIYIKFLFLFGMLGLFIGPQSIINL